MLEVSVKSGIGAALVKTLSEERKLQNAWCKHAKLDMVGTKNK